MNKDKFHPKKHRFNDASDTEMLISLLFLVVLIAGFFLFGLDFIIGYLLGAVIMFAQGREFIESNLL